MRKIENRPELNPADTRTLVKEILSNAVAVIRYCEDIREVDKPQTSSSDPHQPKK